MKTTRESASTDQEDLFMKKTMLCAIIVLTSTITSSSAHADSPYIGHWALTLPNGGAGWLGITEKKGELNAAILWGGGSVKPVTSVKVEGDRLVITRVQVQRRGAAKGRKITETITAKRSGDNLKLVTVKARPDGKEFGRAEFTGKRTPPLPPRPDLSKVEFGEPIALLSGKDLSGWKPLNPKAPMGWSVKDGVLINRTHHETGKPRRAHTNIRTEREFEDFNLRTELRTLKNSNSGIYLRGIYEVQVFESYGRPVGPHNMGAIFGRIRPSVAAERPIGVWQTLDVTLVDRHVTVILNGRTIVDNQPVIGCTGGALWSDPLRPGPIYLQGNHSDIDFRNMVLRPVINPVAVKAPKPHIVLVLADDLGWGDVGFHGSLIKTPHIDALAASGVRLNQFYAQPVCSPTRGALMTGRYPMRLGLQCGVVRPWAEHGLPLDERTLPEALKEAGYVTAIVGKWHLGHLSPEYLPTHRGFDHQYGHYNGALDYFTHIRDGGFDWHKNDRRNDDVGYATDLIGKEAVRLISEHDKTKPLFLYVPFNAPHTPLQAPQSYIDRYASMPNERRRTFAAMVSCMDDAIGRIVKSLKESRFPEGSNRGLRAGKGTLYEGGLRVPTVMVWPGKLKADTEVDQPLHMVDLYPTLLRLAGVSADQPKSVDGRDAWPTITRGASSPHDFVLHNVTPFHGAIRMGDWKLVYNGHVPANSTRKSGSCSTSRRTCRRKTT
ncbi:MAG: sulfatase-like hydrolase/transferase [Planctomycetota bacterium]